LNWISEGINIKSTQNCDCIENVEEVLYIIENCFSMIQILKQMPDGFVDRTQKAQLLGFKKLAGVETNDLVKMKELKEDSILKPKDIPWILFLGYSSAVRDGNEGDSRHPSKIGNITIMSGNITASSSGFYSSAGIATGYIHDNGTSMIGNRTIVSGNTTASRSSSNSGIGTGHTHDKWTSMIGNLTIVNGNIT
jgi:hypothetical protein